MKVETEPFSVMSNPFNIHHMGEEEAVIYIKAKGLRAKKNKTFGKVISVSPVGDDASVYACINELIEQRIYILNGAIGIKG